MGGQRADIGIDEKVAFLSRPEAWARRPATVEVVETHLSFVFLAGSEVYKLKKPVRFGDQDLRSTEARRRSCETEVRLNQRLAASVYLGAVPLSVGQDRALAVGRAGAPVDWLVRMRRLPAERFLDQAIRSGTVDPASLRAAARTLAVFHRRLPPAVRDVRVYLSGLVRQVDEATRALAAPEVGGPSAAVEAVRRALLGWVETHGDRLRERVAAGRVVEGHGDLRPEHVALLAEPVVIDCLEFDVRLRTLDTVDELAWLALECERLGAPEVGAAFLEAWRVETDDPVPDGLVAFHQAMRSLTRASLPALRLADDAHDRARDDALSERLHARLRSYLSSAQERVAALGERA